MNELITLFLYLVCTGHGDMCRTVAFNATREEVAIISCESGDGHNYMTFDTHARSATNDGGLYQFNDKTYEILTGKTNAENDTYDNQQQSFVKLWNNGRGWRHWKASQPCWSQWLTIRDDVAVWK